MYRHRDHGVVAPDAKWRARVTVIVGPENALTVPKSSLAWRIDGDSLGVWVLTWATRAATVLVSRRHHFATIRSMSNLTLKGIPEALHQRLRDAAEANRRSLNGEAIHRLERSIEDDARVAWAGRERAGAPYDPGVLLRDPEPELITLAEFIALPDGDPYRLELAAGRVVREPAPGFRHGRVASRLSRILWEVSGELGHGEVFFDMGFLLTRDPPTVRIPDVAFVSATRLAENATDEVFLAIAPDLAVEVLSPSSPASEIQRKVLEYLDAGARLVWIVDPAEETVTVYRARDDIRVLGVGEVLDGTAAVPGLEVEVGRLFG